MLAEKEKYYLSKLDNLFFGSSLTNLCPVCQSAVAERAICKDKFFKASRRQTNGVSIAVESDVRSVKGIPGNNTRYDEFRAIESPEIEGVKTISAIDRYCTEPL